VAGEFRRVLVVAGPATGGLRTHVTALARHLASRGWPVTVAAPGATLRPLRDRADPAIQLQEVPIGATSASRAASAHRALRHLAASHDVVHAHGLRAAAAAVLACRAVPVVATWHNAPLRAVDAVTGHAVLERLVARRCALVLTVSPDLAARARRAGARRVQLVEVPAPPLPPAPAGVDPSEVRARLGVPGNRPLVLAVARLDRQKALDTLIRAAAGWQRPGDPVVVVAGDGPLRARLESLAQQLRAPVTLLGERDDVPQLLAAADVFALPSHWEGWPLALAEALHAGLPAVVSDLPGPRRLAAEAAAYVPAGQPDALRRAIDSVLADIGLRSRLSAAAIRRAAEWLSLEEANDAILARYLEVS